MSCSYQINSFVCILKNAKMSSLHQCKVANTKLFKSCLEILKKTGFISNYIQDGKYDIVVDINYDMNDKNPFCRAESITKPSRRKYVSVEKLRDFIKKDSSRFGVISTSSGIISISDALERGIGGELLFFV